MPALWNRFISPMYPLYNKAKAHPYGLSMARDEDGDPEPDSPSEAFPDAVLKFGDEKAYKREYNNALTDTTLETLKGITAISRRAQNGTLKFEDASYLKAISEYMKPVFNAAIPLIIKKFGIAVAKKLQEGRKKNKEIFEDPLEPIQPVLPVTSRDIMVEQKLPSTKNKVQTAETEGME